jgi:arylsulfatase A-like enzyme
MRPDSPTVSYVYNDPSTAETDWIVAREAADHIARMDFDLMFVYLGYTDTAGHDHGWMTRPYIDAISNADRCIAHVLDSFHAKGIRPNLLILSDHGGHDRSHGTEMPEDMTIPWVMNGPGIKHGFEITESVRIFDAAPTLAALAGLPSGKHWEGRVVSEAFAES